MPSAPSTPSGPVDAVPSPWGAPQPVPPFAPQPIPAPAPAPYRIPPTGTCPASLAPLGPAPQFTAADRNSGVDVDGTGVFLNFFGEEVDFLWSEIGAVRYERVRRDRVLRVAVTLYDGSVYDCEVDGRRAARVDEWIRLLDPVLRHYLPA
ncbi:hypothetical protein O1L60_24780 [Streptomyces diastatochromogenes]|nr:hypothetical protein [Streptomyces diastatochromogenes]